MKWNISKKSSYIVGNKEFTRKICILNLRNRRKSIFAKVIISYYRWKKITKKKDKIIIKSAYGWSNWVKFRKCITGGKLVHAGVNRYGQEQNQEDTICHIHFHLKSFFVSTYVKSIVMKLHVSRLGLHWAFWI